VTLAVVTLAVMTLAFVIVRLVIMPIMAVTSVFLSGIMAVRVIVMAVVMLTRDAGVMFTRDAGVGRMVGRMSVGFAQALIARVKPGCFGGGMGLATVRRMLAAGVMGMRLFAIVCRPLVTALAPRGQALSALVGLLLSLEFRCRFLVEERLSVGHRDLVVVRVDFGEGEKAVPVATVLDEAGLQRWLDPRHFGQINVATQRLLGCTLEIELFYAAIAEDDDTRLLRVARIDEHLVGFGVVHCAVSAVARQTPPGAGSASVERGSGRPPGKALTPFQEGHDHTNDNRPTRRSAAPRWV
jgi:hypothetical protein